MAKKKKYNTKTVATIWANESEEGNEFTTVSMQKKKFRSVKIYAEDLESGDVYEIKKFKCFENDNHDDILANLCVELNDDDYSVLVEGE